MRTSLRILTFGILFQFTATGWGAVSSGVEAGIGLNSSADDSQWQDVPGFELLLKLQESLQTGQSWDELYQQYIEAIVNNTDAGIPQDSAATSPANLTNDNNPQSLNNEQEFNGLLLPQGFENNGIGWDAFSQEFFANLTSDPASESFDNPGNDNNILPSIEFSSGDPGINWDEFTQQYFDSLNSNPDWNVLNQMGNSAGDNNNPPNSEQTAGYPDFGSNSTDPYNLDGNTIGYYGNNAYDSSGGFGSGFSAQDFYSSLTNNILYSNTSLGAFALSDNLTGHNNTASGVEAMLSNISGVYNSAHGARVLEANISGHYNSAMGANALKSNISGHYNLANGFRALYANKTGNGNSANGYKALFSNTTGNYNTADGLKALYQNTTGKNNTAIGLSALLNNKTGKNNTALGTQGLSKMTSGNRNLAVGMNAGINLVRGFENVYIANPGKVSESFTIRIGKPGHARTFISGIRGRATGMSDSVPVVIDSHGQLGTINSSARFKKEIRDMKDASHDLLKLRPVTYRYKQANDNGENPVEYGLIAEEVAKVYPELVAHSADGQIETVQYHKLTPMLLNELQVMHKLLANAQDKEKVLEAQLSSERLKNQQQTQQLAALSEQFRVMQSQAKIFERLQERLSRIEAQQMVGYNR